MNTNSQFAQQNIFYAPLPKHGIAKQYQNVIAADISLIFARYLFLFEQHTIYQNSCTLKTPQLNAPQGNIYMGARYLDPKYSRWISVDPALGEYIPAAGKGNSENAGNLPGMGGVFNHINGDLYHYAGNNPVRYVDPDGREGVLYFIAETTGKTATKIGLCAADGPLPIGDIIVVIWTLYELNKLLEDEDITIINTGGPSRSQAKNISDKNIGILQNSLFGGGPITSASPSPMFDPDDKSSRNKPKQNGEPNSTEVEYNYDRSVKRITQYDEKGNFMKEIRPNSKGQHGIDGPTTKEPFYNTRPDGRTFRNGYIIRAATPEEIKLLGSF